MCLNLFRFLVLVFLVEVIASKLQPPSFKENYDISYGRDYFKSSHQGRQVELFLDNPVSGSEFISNLRYGSGSFKMSIKLPGNDSTGVITNFKIESFSSATVANKVEFGFLHDRKVKHYLIQTNVYAIGAKDKQQIIRLWFDPAASFHSNAILWNQHQIVSFVDRVPIRVYRNNSKMGVPYPTIPMKVVASLWNGKALDHCGSTNYGRSRINWRCAPFRAQFQSLGIDGCPYNTTNLNSCYSSKFWWNIKKYWKLTPNQEKLYQHVMLNYVIYNYCTDKEMYPETPLDCPSDDSPSFFL